MLNGWIGILKEDIIMYHWVEDKEFVSSMRQLCGDIMQDLCHTLKVDYDISATFYLVGSGARNLILQNANVPIDLDYNLEIVGCEDYEKCKELKQEIKKAFNQVLREYKLDDCDDSTSSLTTKYIRFTEGNQTLFSMDVAITCRDTKNNYYRLIHDKGYNSWSDKYSWNQAPNSKRVAEKVKEIKSKGKWQEVRTQYINLKNKYLKANDHNHPSFVCYIEAVNNVYNKCKSKKK